MELTNDFVIDRPVDETWKILNDLEFIAPCMPGARCRLRSRARSTAGPSRSRSDRSRRSTRARRRSSSKTPSTTRRNSKPKAGTLVRATPTPWSRQRWNPVGDAATKVTIHTDLKLSGKVASFGRGIIEDVSKNILGQFVDNLRDKLEAEGGPQADPGTSDSGTSDSGTSDSGTSDSGTSDSGTSDSGTSDSDADGSKTPPTDPAAGVNGAAAPPAAGHSGAPVDAPADALGHRCSGNGGRCSPASGAVGGEGRFGKRKSPRSDESTPPRPSPSIFSVTGGPIASHTWHRSRPSPFSC